MKKIFIISLAILAIGATSCKKKKVNNLKEEFKTTYADIVHASYEDSYNSAVTLKADIDAFVAAPSDAGFSKCKASWLSAREPYGQTETYRFAAGPIDDADGPEGALNAWPLDEGYIDYVTGAATSGIVNDVLSTLNRAALTDANEAGGEKNISIGYHAIEFLLWGQDDANTALKTPGQRPYTDYLATGGTAENQDRRGIYLQIVADILVEDLSSLVAEWKKGGSYRSTFESQDADVSMKNILTGMAVLSKSELAGERVFVALDNQDQEDEHSCFADNTHRDVILNFVGIQNLYKGEYKRINGSTISGTSLADIAEKTDKDLKEKLDNAFAAADVAVKAIPVPFDFALTQETPGGSGPINTSVTELQKVGDLISELGSELDLTINTSLPE